MSARWSVGAARKVQVYEGDRFVCTCLTQEDARRLVAAMNACVMVKAHLVDLEAGCPPDDPLTQIRKLYHAPLHAVLDEALEVRK